jgi:hypothetical protein
VVAHGDYLLATPNLVNKAFGFLEFCFEPVIRQVAGDDDEVRV